MSDYYKNLIETEIGQREDLAAEWLHTNEQWIFCTDTLDEFDIPRTEENVNLLEESFAKLLGVTL